jgi:hypothetical protein
VNNPTRISANDLRDIEESFRDDERFCSLVVAGMTVGATMTKFSVGKSVTTPTDYVNVQITIQFTAEIK